MSKTKKDYSQRSDLEKVKANWNKVKGLHYREEWSTVILRAVTTVELTANLVIRKELEGNKNLDSKFVDNLLLWANGIRGKFDKLIIPLFEGTPEHKELKNINKKVQDINKERNSIAHSGQFKKKSTAEKVIKESQLILSKLLELHHPEFKLKPVINEN